MAVFSRITLLAGTAARCVHAMNRRGLAMANPTATFKTTKGEFKVELFEDKLPITTSVRCGNQPVSRVRRHRHAIEQA